MQMKTGPIELDEIVTALRLLGGEAQAKYIKDKVTELRGGMPAHYGRSHSYRETIQKKIEDHCPQSDNWKSSNRPVFERVRRGVYRLIEEGPTEEQRLKSQIEEDLNSLAEEEGAVEGEKKAKLIAYFERNPALRTAAVAFHGTTCKACGFNFEAAYGERGRDYIEVHHLVPISTLPEPSSINPKEDLTVLCSNCHRMVHRKRDAPLSIEELRSIVSRSGTNAEKA